MTLLGRMAELVDALVSGTSGSNPWKFESSYAHQEFMGL